MSQLDIYIIISFVSMFIGLLLGYFLKWETRQQMADKVPIKTLLSNITIKPQKDEDQDRKEHVIWVRK